MLDNGILVLDERVFFYTPATYTNLHYGLTHLTSHAANL